MDRGGLGHLSFNASDSLIKYFRSSVSEIWYSINIFVIIVDVSMTSMDDLLVP